METSHPSYHEFSHFSWSQHLRVLSVIWRYHPLYIIVFHSTKDCAGQFCYFCKKWRNCNSNIILETTGKAIKCFLMSWKTTDIPLGEEQLIWNQSCPCLAIWCAEAMENDLTNPPHLSCLFFFLQDKKIALHYISLSSLGCESQWQMSLSLKRAKHIWDWLLWGWPRIINQWQ